MSCYADLDRARELAPYADYLAFGSVFPSSTKPNAAEAALEILGPAQDAGDAGGGDRGDRCRRMRGAVLEAGADAIAVISGVFGGASVAEATAALVKVIS